MAKGFVIAAPQSGSGKTLITLGLIAAYRARGLKVVSAKAGPDYIDPGFHAAASGIPCINLDYWAMGKSAVSAMACEQASKADLLVVEGVMGLFDGPQGAEGSSADLAKALNLPVVLVVDATRQSQSIAALVQGFMGFDPELKFSGVILNRVASDRHETILREALTGIGVNVLGALRQIDSLALPSRHLGLIQAQENQHLTSFISSAASRVARETLLDTILETAGIIAGSKANHESLPPLGQSIAIARDAAFSFAYPHVMEGWRKAGAEISFFSPLADELPSKSDAIYLPGGYPELHAAKLTHSKRFFSALHQHQGLIYGECGGYMALGDGLIDADGVMHPMAGLLPLTTSFETRKLHLGYRQLTPLNGPWTKQLRGHEFHYSTVQSQGKGAPLFAAKDATGNELAPMGQRLGNVMGSYAHVVSVSPHV